MDLTNEMVSVIKTYPWQCMDCKTCVECMDPYDEVLHVVLNAEARSWGWGGGVRATCEILIIAPPKKFENLGLSLVFALGISFTMLR